MNVANDSGKNEFHFIVSNSIQLFLTQVDLIKFNRSTERLKSEKYGYGVDPVLKINYKDFIINDLRVREHGNLVPLYIV